MTSDTMSMYSDDDEDDANQLGSNVKINDPVKMYLKEIGRVELLNHGYEVVVIDNFCNSYNITFILSIL